MWTYCPRAFRQTHTHTHGHTETQISNLDGKIENSCCWWWWCHSPQRALLLLLLLSSQETGGRGTTAGQLEPQDTMTAGTHVAVAINHRRGGGGGQLPGWQLGEAAQTTPTSQREREREGGGEADGSSYIYTAAAAAQHSILTDPSIVERKKTKLGGASTSFFFTH